jgi:hypothetical protein
MVAKIQILRSITPGSRPAGHTYGEPYVNLGDNQLGVFDSSNVARDLIGVPMFSPGTTYVAGQAVSYQGLLYIARQAISAAAWNAAQWFQPLQQVVTGGLLSFVSATQLKFAPYNGNYVKINGVLYRIPSPGGIAGLGNTNITINGVAGRTPVVNSPYLVAVFNNAGVLTADFLTGYTHGPSATVGNEGVEVSFLSGTEAPDRSIIGLVYFGPSGQFMDQADVRCVRSWFNQPGGVTAFGNNFNAPGITNSGSWVGQGALAQIVCFAGERVEGGFNGYASNTVLNQDTYTTVLINGGAPSGAFGYGYHSTVGGNGFGSIAPRASWISGTDTSHYAQVGAQVSAGGNGTINGYSWIRSSR